MNKSRKGTFASPKRRTPRGQPHTPASVVEDDHTFHDSSMYRPGGDYDFYAANNRMNDNIHKLRDAERGYDERITRSGTRIDDPKIAKMDFNSILFSNPELKPGSRTQYRGNRTAPEWVQYVRDSRADRVKNLKHEIQKDDDFITAFRTMQKHSGNRVELDPNRQYSKREQEMMGDLLANPNHFRVRHPNESIIVRRLVDSAIQKAKGDERREDEFMPFDPELAKTPLLPLQMLHPHERAAVEKDAFRNLSERLLQDEDATVGFRDAVDAITEVAQEKFPEAFAQGRKRRPRSRKPASLSWTARRK